jgi:hypothetical protein
MTPPDQLESTQLLSTGRQIPLQKRLEVQKVFLAQKRDQLIRKVELEFIIDAHFLIFSKTVDLNIIITNIITVIINDPLENLLNSFKRIDGNIFQ